MAPQHRAQTFEAIINLKHKIMNKLIFLFFAATAFFSCKKSSDGTDNSLAETPVAKVAFDNSNYGIYKGVFVGSSGIIIVNINNNNTVSATLTVDNVTYNFTTTQTVQQGQATTVNFTSGVNSFTFTVSANGANPTITNLIVNGHPNAAILVVKETSTSLVKCFEGNYSGTESGIFNAVIYNAQIKGLAKSGINTYTVDGTVSNNQINAGGVTSGGSVFVGTVSGNSIAGTWSNTAVGASGNWSGTRTY
jgi:hypothetical protein